MDQPNFLPLLPLSESVSPMPTAVSISSSVIVLSSADIVGKVDATNWPNLRIKMHNIVNQSIL